MQKQNQNRWQCSGGDYHADKLHDVLKKGVKNVQCSTKQASALHQNVCRRYNRVILGCNKLTPIFFLSDQFEMSFIVSVCNLLDRW